MDMRAQFKTITQIKESFTIAHMYIGLFLHHEIDSCRFARHETHQISQRICCQRIQIPPMTLTIIAICECMYLYVLHLSGTRNLANAGFARLRVV